MARKTPTIMERVEGFLMGTLAKAEPRAEAKKTKAKNIKKKAVTKPKRATNAKKAKKRR